MIKCIVCGKNQEESYFVELRYGGLAICVYCEDTSKAKELREESKERMEEAYQERMEYEQKRKERIKHQHYEGEFDWM